MKSLQKGGSIFLKGLYTGYIALILALLFIPMWLSIMLPSQKTARKVIRFWARTILLLAFCPMSIKGKEYVASEKPVVYAINHASYIDSVVLLAVLPINTSIVGKSELATAPILKQIIRKLGHPLVERFEFSKSVEDAKKIQGRLHQGESIAIFPEGTFTYASGLRPFKLGAFKMAAETQNPICPIALNGTRKIMRDSIYLLRPNHIKITFSQCINPTGTELQAVSQLRKKTRDKIAKYCGEEMIHL